MFSEKKTNPKTSQEINRISRGTTIIGDIESEGDFRIDGAIEGSIKTSGRVILGKKGIVKGDIHCLDADVEGSFSGNLVVSNMLTLKSTAKIVGDVVIGKLSVESGATFNATCSMKGTVKDLNEQKKDLKKSV